MTANLVWSVIAVGEKITTSRDPTQPLAGGPRSIFAPTVTKAETVIDAVGVYDTQRAANAAAHNYIETHPGYRVKVKVIPMNGTPETVRTDQRPDTCTACGKPTAGGGLCPPCQKQHWEACRNSDPDLLEELEHAARPVTT